MNTKTSNNNRTKRFLKRIGAFSFAIIVAAGAYFFFNDEEIEVNPAAGNLVEAKQEISEQIERNLKIVDQKLEDQKMSLNDERGQSNYDQLVELKSELINERQKLEANDADMREIKLTVDRLSEEVN